MTSPHTNSPGGSSAEGGKAVRPPTNSSRLRFINRTRRLMNRREEVDQELLRQAARKLEDISEEDFAQRQSLLRRSAELAKAEKKHLRRYTLVLEDQQKRHDQHPSTPGASNLAVLRTQLSNFKRSLAARLDKHPTSPLDEGEDQGADCSLGDRSDAFDASLAHQSSSPSLSLRAKRERKKHSEGNREQLLSRQDEGSVVSASSISADRGNVIGKTTDKDEVIPYHNLRARAVVEDPDHDDCVRGAPNNRRPPTPEHDYYMSGAIHAGEDDGFLLSDDSDSSFSTEAGRWSAPRLVGKHSVGYVVGPANGPRSVDESSPLAHTKTARRLLHSTHEETDAGVELDQYTSSTTSQDGVEEAAPMATSSRHCADTDSISRPLTTWSDGLMRIAGVTPAVAHLAVLPASPAPSLGHGGSNTDLELERLREEDRIILAVERQVWKKRMGF